MAADEYHDISRFSIFRHFSEGTQRSQEAISIYQFFIRVQDFLQITDIDYGPNPPDFVIKTAQEKIGVELTWLNPKVFPKGGYRKKKEFRIWQQETKKSRSKLNEFFWGEFTVRESLAAFQEQFLRKAKRISALQEKFNEYWLIFHLDSGSPAGGVVELNSTPSKQQKESVLNYAGKYLYEMAQICRKPHPFSCVILCCGMRFLSFTAGSNPHGLPVPSRFLLDLGAKASDTFLDWKHRLSDVSAHWDESQGDLDAWLRIPIEKLFNQGE